MKCLITRHNILFRHQENICIYIFVNTKKHVKCNTSIHPQSQAMVHSTHTRCYADSFQVVSEWQTVAHMQYVILNHTHKMISLYVCWLNNQVICVRIYIVILDWGYHIYINLPFGQTLPFLLPSTYILNSQQGQHQLLEDSCILLNLCIGLSHKMTHLAVS